jgi:hypothetical protein
MRALQVLAAPGFQRLGGALVLHPFGKGGEAEPPGEIDQRAHEGAIVLGADEIFNEGAVDLDDIDAELAQVAE